MATLLFKFVFLDNSSPAVTLTSVDLNSSDTPVVNISKTAFADGAVSSEVAGGALTYDAFTKSWGYRLAGADLASYLYVGMATTSYDIAAAVDVHALGMVVPDELVSSRLKPTVLNRTVNVDADGAIATVTNIPGQQVRDAMQLAVTDAGDTQAGSVDAKLDGLGGSIGPGSSTGYYTDTVDDGTDPLDGVRVQLYTGASRSGLAYEAYTNALGVFEMWPDPGVYYRWMDLSGFSFTQDVEVPVTEP